MSIVRVSDLRQQVYDDLRQRIVNGAFPPDTKFQEVALAEELGVSRTPVREALAMLVRDGLLTQMKRGFRFPRRSPRDVLDIIEVGLRLEPYAIRSLTEQLAADERRDLAAESRKEIDDHANDGTFIEAHSRFRRALMRRVRNRVLVEALQQFEDFIHLMRAATLSDPYWRQKSIDGNHRLIDAIEAGDGPAAEAAQIALLEMARDAFLSYLAKTEDWTESQPSN